MSETTAPDVTALPRAELRQKLAAAERARGRAFLPLAVWAVLGGFGQLALIRVLDARLPHARATLVEGLVFLAYLAAFLAIGAFALARVRRFKVACPACGKALEGTSAEIAMASGRCPGCGAIVARD